MAVLAVAVGFIIRSTAGGVATVCGLLLVAPTAGLLLPASWREHLLPYLPSNAATAVLSAMPAPDSLSAAAGSVVLGVWPLVTVAAAALVLRRRDV